MDNKIIKHRFKEVFPFLIVFLCSCLLLFVLLVLRNNSVICEKITCSVTAFLNRISGTVSQNVSVSVFEVFVFTASSILLLLLIYLLVIAVNGRKIRALKGFCIICTICMLFGSYYMFTAGFAYNRAELPQFYEGEMEYYDFYEAVKYFKSDYDSLALGLDRDDNGCVICPYSFDQLNDIIVEETKRLPNYYNDCFFRAKPMQAFSGSMSDFRITGVTFTPTGDCGINMLQPQSSMTSTMAHEYMHAMGVMRENEANAVSCYLLISSKNDYLRYCGYYAYYSYLLRALAINYDKDEYAAVMPNSIVYDEYDFERAFWNSRVSFTDKIGDFFNSLYLKLSGSNQGTASYHEGTGSGGTYTEQDRVFISVQYNTFQQAFIRTFLQNTADTLKY